MTQVLSHQSKRAIDDWLKKFPENQKQSGVLFALRVVQQENGGWLTESLMDSVAAYLRVPKIAVYEVASFYSMFELKPVGKYKICVCTSVTCLLCDSDKIITHLKNRLGVEVGETTPDNRFTLKGVECLAACGVAPAVQIGRVYYENVTPEKMDKILEGLE